MTVKEISAQAYARVERTTTKVGGERVDLANLAFRMGAADYMALSVSEPFYKDYERCDDDGKAAYKATFVKNYFMGRTRTNAKRADALLALPRGEREAEGTEYQNALRAAQMKFNYHFITRGDTDSSTAQSASESIQNAIPRGATRPLTQMVTQYFDGDFDAAIRALKALKKANAA